MKKVVSLFLSVVMLISVFAGFGVTAQAEEKRDAWIEYEVNSDGRTATITAITGTEQGYANPQGETKRIHATKILYGFGYTCEIGNPW